MAPGLTSEQLTLYTFIIDKILRKSDLNLISSKAIRKELASEVDYDVAEQKDAINALIIERFDNISKTTPPASDHTTNNAKPKANGSAKREIKTEVKSEVEREVKRERDPSESSAAASTPQTPGEDSEVDVKPQVKKRKREHDSDAKLAAMLQAEENSRARPSRGGINKKPPVKKRTTPKKKSAAKIKKDDDSDIELGSDGEPKEVIRKGGFHKQYNLSDPLAALVGFSQLSRPQVVKKIWEHIKALDLQDPGDKRQIMCDDKMYAVFKQDKVHMFTMNKLLGKQLYPVEEDSEISN